MTGLGDVVAFASSITDVDATGAVLRYRGVDVELTPGRRLPSISACLTQWRRDSLPTPICGSRPGDIWTASWELWVGHRLKGSV
jgi:hypothetical protein